MSSVRGSVISFKHLASLRIWLASLMKVKAPNVNEEEHLIFA